MAGAPPPSHRPAMVRRFLNSIFALCSHSFEEADGSCCLSTRRPPTEGRLIYKPMVPEARHEQPSIWFWKKLPWRDRSAHAIRLVGSDLRRRLRSVSSCLENSESLAAEVDEGRELEIRAGIRHDSCASHGDAVSMATYSVFV